MEMRKFYKRLYQLCYHTMIRFEIVTPHTGADFFLINFLRCLLCCFILTEYICTTSPKSTFEAIVQITHHKNTKGLLKDHAACYIKPKCVKM